MARKANAEFKIGVEAQDIRALSVRVVLIEAVRTGDAEASGSGKEKLIRLKRLAEVWGEDPAAVADLTTQNAAAGLAWD